MTLSHCELQSNFLLSNDRVNVLVVEQEKQFTRYCKELLDAINEDGGNFCLFHKDEAVKMGKCCAVITDVFSLEIESKRTVGKFLGELKTIAEQNYSVELYKIRSEIFSLLAKLNAESSYELEFDEEKDLTELFKAFGVKISQEFSSLLERIVAYIKLQARYLSVKHFFFVNLKCFLSPEELVQLYREAELEQVTLFLLENSLKEAQEKEKILLVDRDFCEILVKN